MSVIPQRCKKLRYIKMKKMEKRKFLHFFLLIVIIYFFYLISSAS